LTYLVLFEDWPTLLRSQMVMYGISMHINRTFTKYCQSLITQKWQLIQIKRQCRMRI